MNQERWKTVGCTRRIEESTVFSGLNPKEPAALRSMFTLYHQVNHSFNGLICQEKSDQYQTRQDKSRGLNFCSWIFQLCNMSTFWIIRSWGDLGWQGCNQVSSTKTTTEITSHQVFSDVFKSFSLTYPIGKPLMSNCTILLPFSHKPTQA